MSQHIWRLYAPDVCWLYGMLHLFDVSLLPVINFGLVYVFIPLTFEYFIPVKEIIIFIGYYLLEV